MENNKENDIKLAEEIADEMDATVVPSWSDDMDMNLDLDSFFGEDENESEEENTINIDENAAISLADNIIQENNTLVDFSIAYETYLQKKAIRNHLDYRKNIDKMSKSINRSLVDKSILKKISDIKQKLLIDGYVRTQGDLLNLLNEIPTEYLYGITDEIQKNLHLVAQSKVLDKDDINKVIEILTLRENIISPNIKVKEKDNTINPNDIGIVNSLSVESKKLHMEDIDVIYAVNEINHKMNSSNEIVMDEIKCSRSTILNDKLTSAYVDINYPDNIKISTKGNSLSKSSYALRIINTDILNEMDNGKKVTKLYKLPYIFINKILIILPDIAIYNEIKYNLDKKLDESLINYNSKDVDYVKVIENGDSLNILTTKSELEDSTEEFMMYTNEELGKIVNSEVFSKKLVDGISVGLEDVSSKSINSNNTTIKSNNLSKSIMISTLTKYISKENNISKTYSENKEEIQRDLIKSIIPRISTYNQLNKYIVDANYMLGDNSWFIENITDEKTSKIKSKELIDFINGENNGLFKDVTVDSIMSIPSFKNKSKMNELTSKLFKLSVEINDIINDNDKVEINESFSNIDGMVKEILKIDYGIVENEYITPILNYIKSIFNKDEIITIKSININEKYNNVNLNKLNYALEYNDYSVTPKDEIPYQYLKLFDIKFNISEKSQINIENTNWRYSGIPSDSNFISILMNILNGKTTIQEPIIRRILSILVTDRYRESLSNERAIKRVIDNTDIILTDIDEIEELKKDSRFKYYIIAIESIISLLSINNESELILKGIFNEELSTLTKSKAEELLSKALDGYKYDKDSLEYKDLLDAKSELLLLESVLPLSTKEYCDLNNEVNKFQNMYIKSLDKVEKRELTNINDSNLKERNNIAYKAYLKTGNTKYLNGINRDYVDVDLLISEQNIPGEYSPTEMLEKYNMEDKRSMFETDNVFDYQDMILEIEKINPNIKYELPIPIVDMVESTEMIVPEDTAKFFINDNSKFNIIIKTKGR